MGQSCRVQHTPHMDAVHFFDAKLRHFGQWYVPSAGSDAVSVHPELLSVVAAGISLICGVFCGWPGLGWMLLPVVVAAWIMPGEAGGGGGG